jgi:hypothetical protein
MISTKRLLLTALFIGSAAIPFVLLTAPPAHASANITVSGVEGCAPQFGGDYYFASYCSFPVGTDIQTSTMTGAYFDFYSATTDHVLLQLIKRSFTGGVYIDQFSVSDWVGYRDSQLRAVNTKMNPSNWDYMAARITNENGGTALQPGNLIGITLFIL